MAVMDNGAVEAVAEDEERRHTDPAENFESIISIRREVHPGEVLVLGGGPCLPTYSTVSGQSMLTTPAAMPMSMSFPKSALINL